MNVTTAGVIDWVCNDQPIHARLVKIYSGKDRFRGRRASSAWGRGDADGMLTGAGGDFIQHILDDKTNSVYRSLYRQAGGHGYERRYLDDVRENLGEFTWLVVHDGVVVTPDTIDWSEVRAHVMRGED